jgi:hypothetical protein
MQGAPPRGDNSSEVFELIKYLEHLSPTPKKLYNTSNFPLFKVPIIINSIPQILKQASYDSTCTSPGGNDI